MTGDSEHKRHGWHLYLHQRMELPMALTRRILRGRVGRRGEFLIFAGAAFVLIGYGYVVSPVLRRSGVHVVHDLVPPPWWGVAWIVAGVVGVAFAWARKPGRDRLGYAALILMPSLQAGSYATSWVLYLIHQPGDPRGVYSALVYVAFARFITITAGWPEPRVSLADLRPRGDL